MSFSMPTSSPGWKDSRTFMMRPSRAMMTEKGIVDFLLYRSVMRLCTSCATGKLSLCERTNGPTALAVSGGSIDTPSTTRPPLFFFS